MKKIIVGQNENLFRQALIIRKESLLHNLLHYYTYCFLTHTAVSVSLEQLKETLTLL